MAGEEGEQTVSTREYVVCPYCRDHQNHVTERRWWDYIFRFPEMLMGKVPRRCEHCYRRFWVDPNALALGEEPRSARRR